MTALVIRGDALHLPLRDNSVDLIVTSPPYLWKRKYAIDGTGEMGNERDWRAYLHTLFIATGEMLRVLKRTGSIWVNLGDTRVTGTEAKWLGIPVKSKLLLPERYRVGCQDRFAPQGVIVRHVQVWSKDNGLPESVTDRPRDSHEDWVQLTKSPRYFAALDELRTPTGNDRRPGKSGAWMNGIPDVVGSSATTQDHRGRLNQYAHPLGALPGSVWSIPSEPLRLPPWIDTAHYAAFPSEWPRRLILGFTPHLVCGVCGVGRFPVVDRQYLSIGDTFAGGTLTEGRHRSGKRMGDGIQATIVGYACGCTPFTDHPGTGEHHADGRYGDALARGDGYSSTMLKLEGGHLSNRPKVGPWREYHLDRFTPPPGHPAVVADVFGGTGTVLHVAHALGRHAISIDLSEPYCRLAADTSLGSLARQRAAKVQGRVHLERQGSLL